MVRCLAVPQGSEAPRRSARQMMGQAPWGGTIAADGVLHTRRSSHEDFTWFYGVLLRSFVNEYCGG